jgi:Ca2+-binding RTX toxin-like protein
MTRAPKKLISITLSLLVAFTGSIVQTQSAAAAARGADFTVTVSDLQFILDQIRIAESHRAIEATSPAVTPSTNVLTLGRVLDDPMRATGGGNARTLAIANTVTQVLTPLLQDGLRQVDGRNNNLTGNGFSSWMGFGYISPNLGKSAWGAADTLFPRIVGPVFRSGYETRTGNVTDAAPRVISNLIADQSELNPAARSAAGCTLSSLNLPNPCTPSTTLPDPSLFIRNHAPNGVAAPYNGIFTLFGQFFSHGLDLVGKSSTESVKIPLATTDPLYNACVNLTNRGCVTEFSMGRTDLQTGTATGGKNTTTPWIDQNQTYTSHPSHQVFLREYFCRGLETASTILPANKCTSANPPIATGKLIDGDIAGNIANWKEVKRQATNKLGIELVDMDIHDVPLLLTDEYGRFLRSSTGFPQVVTGNNGTTATVNVGNPATPVSAGVSTGHAFLDDIAHTANPKEGLSPDGDSLINNYPGQTSYDNELLDAHFITGDGRGNENIGLTSMHTIFHAEHNRLWADIQDVINSATTVTSGLTANDLADFKSAWRMSSIRTANSNPEWNGERLFHAAKLITEMEYQHIVFGEFVRKVQPAVKLFRAYDPTIRPDIVAEFAHTVYRYGHSQLNETVERTAADGTDLSVPLLYGFLNPGEFNQPKNYADPRNPVNRGIQLNGYNAAGSVLRGMANQTGNEIDEFVTGALRNNLLGLPLDLATLNIARGRDAGISTLNGFRSAIKSSTGATNMSPYTSWAQFGQNLRHSDSLANFIAAYGNTSGDLTFLNGATADVEEDTVTVSLNSADNSGDYKDKRTAAQSIVDCYEAYRLIGGTEPCETFMLGTSGLNDIDLWIGGLAEKNIQAGTMLGNAFDYVFKKQIENLQESDRFYYLGRVGGLNLGTQIETNFLSDVIMRNTNVTSITTDAFAVPTKTINMASAAPAYIKILGDGTWMYTGDAHILWNGTSGNDKVLSDRGDDSIYGDAGNDWLRGGDGDDFIQGGEGRDVIEDTAGLNILIGGNGNDYISGSGTDAYNGNNGDDFLIGGTFAMDAFAGFGNDWLRGGTDDDRLSGDEGDDWAEGGEGSDRVAGDIGVLGVTLTNPGRDVLIGNSGNDLLDGFNGADIFLPGMGTDLNSGGLGFDWVTYFNDGQSEGVAEDLGNFAPAPGLALANLADQYQEVEGLSGGDYDDILSGTILTTLGGAAVDGLSATDCALITGLSTLLPSTITNCVWNGGDIIIGGAGSDTFTGRNGNDLIDGDAVLQTWVSIPSSWGIADVVPSYVSVPAGRAYISSLARVREYIENNLIGSDVIASMQIVRLIAQTGHTTENDVAVFQSPRTNYTITVNANGTITVADSGNGAIALVDGTDTLRNIETLRFSDGDILVSSLPTRAPGLVLSGAVGGSGSIAVTWTAPALLSGTSLASYTARAWTTVNGTGTPAAICTTSNGSTLTCTISGLAARSYWVDVIATNSANVNSPRSTIVGPVAVSAAAAASISPTTQDLSATKDNPISTTSIFTPTGLIGTITYTISAPLPIGLSMEPTTGVITGTPTVTLARAVFTITATAGAVSATSIINITVSDPAAAVITPGTQTISATQNSAITPTTGFTPSNLTSPVVYTISSPLPSGLLIGSTTGIISGTPTGTLATTVFTITATDASTPARTATATISITVAAAGGGVQGAPVSAPASATVTAANGSAIVTWSAVSGATRYTAQAFSSPTSTRVIRQCSVSGNGGASTFSCTLPRLQSFSTYYVDVVARNSVGANSSGSRISVVIP